MAKKRPLIDITCNTKMSNRNDQYRAIVLTALPVEYNEVRKHLAELTELLNKGTVYETGRFVTTTGSWEILLAQIGAGNTSAAFEAERARIWRPRISLFVGVAGAIRTRRADVVAATKIYGILRGKRGDLPRPDVGNCSYTLAESVFDCQTNRMDQSNRRTEQNILIRSLVGPIAARSRLWPRQTQTYKFLKPIQ